MSSDKKTYLGEIWAQWRFVFLFVLLPMSATLFACGVSGAGDINPAWALLPLLLIPTLVAVFVVGCVFWMAYWFVFFNRAYKLFNERSKERLKNAKVGAA